MADNFICIIPNEPWFVPDPVAQKQAFDLFKRLLLEADEINIIVTEIPALIDAGTNLSHVICPYCDTELLDWWLAAMEQVLNQAFHTLDIQTPCCQTTLSLNDLRYDWPCGFARFVLEAQNPKKPLLSVTELHLLQQILGCTLRQILVHI